MLNSFLRNLFGTEEPLTKVVEVRSDSYISRPIHFRDESILLYGPKLPPDPRYPREKYYEIVLHKPFTETVDLVYSLFRSESRELAEERCIVLKEKIPIYVHITKECTVPSLQKLCDILSEHQSWTIAHLASYFDVPSLFNEAEVQKYLNDVDPFTGITPLMVAIKSGNTRMVQSLVSLNCTLNCIDLDGNTIFHYAAASNKEIINLLASKSLESLNTLNKQGYTPLHTACLASAPDCVRALLIAGADVNLTAARRSQALPGIVGDDLPKLNQEDMKYGGTPLHWCSNREVIELLVSKNCDINTPNFDGRTALHVMVIKGRLECVVALLSHNADMSLGDKNGNTPLHLAVKHSNIVIVQALIVFGADLELKNNLGCTARHMVPVELTNSNYDQILYMLHSVGAQRCPSDMEGCGPACIARGDYNGVPPPLIPKSETRDVISQMLAVAAMERASSDSENQRQGRLLCLDGGGIKGLILVQLLLYMEEVLGRPIIHCFDWVAGTSTGGIVALALSCGKTLRECQQLYIRLKQVAFVGRRPYPAEPLENILKECYGTETVMADIKHPKLMILAVLADRKPVDLHLFRNYPSAQEILDEHNKTIRTKAAGDFPSNAEQKVWLAARATGAAPSYFRASGRYMDGGLIGNNPTLDAITELYEINVALRATGKIEEAKKTNLKVVVSCGTGMIPLSGVKDFDVFKPESLYEAAQAAWGLSALVNLLIDQATQSDGRVIERARAWCSTLGVPYYRFSPTLSKEIAMDEKDDKKLVNMLWEAQSYMYENRDQIKELAHLLVDSNEK